MTPDKQAIRQIIGSLMKDTSILGQVDTYNLHPEDFHTPLEKYIFGAICSLYENGAEKLTPFDIDNFLSERKIAYANFEKNNGLAFLQDAEELANLDSFPYYYDKLKKFNALRDLKEIGIDTSTIYPQSDVFDEETEKLKQEFEKLTPLDIFDKVKKQLAEKEAKYGCAAMETEKASEGIEDLLAELAESPQVGAPLQGDILNSICRGCIRGKYFLFSMPTGGGKTRTMVSNACYLAYPVRYNSKTCQWESQGSCEKVLYVATEQTFLEIKSLILAYLADVNEEKILYATYTEEEKERLDKALYIMKHYDNLHLARLPEPNMSEVKSLCRTYAIKEEVGYIFYDYIFITPSLLGEFRDLGIRNDVVLRMLSTLLKDLAVELDVFIMSATQISGNLNEFKGIRDERCLRDSKSIPDKADFGMIATRVSQEEENMLKGLSDIYGLIPNQVCDIYKNRQGRFNKVRIWSYFDLGTLRRKDLFITDDRLQQIKDFTPISFLFDEENIGEYDETCHLLNEGVVSDAAAEKVAEEQKDTSNKDYFEEINEVEETNDAWDFL